MPNLHGMWGHISARKQFGWPRGDIYARYRKYSLFSSLA
jgi:hypothetical protein